MLVVARRGTRRCGYRGRDRVTQRHLGRGSGGSRLGMPHRDIEGIGQVISIRRGGIEQDTRRRFTKRFPNVAVIGYAVHVSGDATNRRKIR